MMVEHSKQQGTLHSEVEAAGNFTQLQRSVEDLCKDRGQLVSTDF